jgi:hypothetical protein
MKRIVLSGIVLASLALPLGLAGCGGGAMEEGTPRQVGPKSDVPTDSIKADMVADTQKYGGPGAGQKPGTPAKPAPATPPAEKKD